jgi:hypothetical protein
VRIDSPLQGRLAQITRQEIIVNVGAEQGVTRGVTWTHWKLNVRLVTPMCSAHQVGYSQGLCRGPD